MAGSYNHCVDKDFNLLNPEDLDGMIENMGDAYEAIEEMVIMINYLTKSDPVKVWEAHEHYLKVTYNHYKPTDFKTWNERRLRD